MKICGVPSFARSRVLPCRFALSDRRLTSISVNLAPLREQESLGSVAIRAIGASCKSRFGIMMAGPDAYFILYMRTAAARHNPGEDSTSTDAAAGAQQHARTGSMVAPRSAPSSTNTNFLPRLPRPCPSAGTRKAPCTFNARADLSSPTCCRVAFTRRQRAMCDGAAAGLGDDLGQ